jgi:hypothetical protein
MAAMQSSSITKTIVEPIKQFGDSVWSLVAKVPTYAPIFPGGQSMQSMQNIPSQISWTISSRQASKASSFIDKNLPMFSWKSWEIKQWLEKLRADLKSNNSIWATQNLNRILKTMDFKWLQQSYEDWRIALLEYLKKFWDPKYKKMNESDFKDEAKLKAALKDARLISLNKWWWNVIWTSAWEDSVEVREYNNWQNSNSHTSSWVKNVSKAEIKLSWSKPVLDLWNIDIEIKKDSEWNYELWDDKDFWKVAKAINDWIIDESLISNFNEKVNESLRKYFNKDWIYIVNWKQKDWKFPWEIKKND